MFKNHLCLVFELVWIPVIWFRPFVRCVRNKESCGQIFVAPPLRDPRFSWFLHGLYPSFHYFISHTELSDTIRSVSKSHLLKLYEKSAINVEFRYIFGTKENQCCHSLSGERHECKKRQHQGLCEEIFVSIAKKTGSARALFLVIKMFRKHLVELKVSQFYVNSE